MDDDIINQPMDTDYGSGTSEKSFKELGIGRWLTRQLDGYGLTRPTPVQVFLCIYALSYCSFRPNVFQKSLKVQMFLAVLKLVLEKRWLLLFLFYRNLPWILMVFLL